MKILKVLKTQDHKFEINLYNEDLTNLDIKEIFDDLYSMNFYLQALQKKYNFYETLIIIHDKVKNEVDLFKNNGEIFLE
ncbi:MAG: hypothetical protein ACM3VV_00505 [Deltaproteobacteria bacterium]